MVKHTHTGTHIHTYISPLNCSLFNINVFSIFFIYHNIFCCCCTSVSFEIEKVEAFYNYNNSKALEREPCIPQNS